MWENLSFHMIELQGEIIFIILLLQFNDPAVKTPLTANVFAMPQKLFLIPVEYRIYNQLR